VESLAYLDPGSGSLLIQAAIAAIVAVPIVFKSTFARIVQSIRDRFGPTDR
jgi:hypothetical protein